jgi:HSP20 family protein
MVPDERLPAVDIHELKDKFVLKADVPGVDEKDIRVEFNDGTLVLEGGSEKEEENKDSFAHVRERSTFKFRRAFELGEGFDPEKIQASYRNGTLTIELPKSERAIPRVIPIKINAKS